MEMIDTDKLTMISLAWDNGNSFVKVGSEGVSRIDVFNPGEFYVFKMRAGQKSKAIS